LLDGYELGFLEAGEARADLNKPWRSIAKRAGLASLRIHELRHTQDLRPLLGAAS
jgi:hypothetical protein